jgi:heme exporter protein B
MPDFMLTAPEGAADPDRPRKPGRIGAPAPAFNPARGPAAAPSVVSCFAAVLGRELRLSLRHGADTLAALLFFVLAAALFPLAIGPEPQTLGRIAPGIVWVCALLAALLPLDRLFGADFEDGSLDQLLLCGLPASMVAAAKALSHWISTGLPLLLAAGPLAVMLRLDPVAVPALLAGLLPGTLVLSLMGAMGAAIVLGARRGGVLLPLLLLPLMTPVLIFGAAASDAVASGTSAAPHLLILSALLCAAVPLCPLAAGAALREAVR